MLEGLDTSPAVSPRPLGSAERAWAECCGAIPPGKPGLDQNLYLPSGYD